MTVEAALVIPFFLFAVLSLLYVLEVMAIQISIRSGMQYAGKNYAERAVVNSFVSGEELAGDIQEAIGPERLEESIIKGGNSGIDCSKSYVDLLNQILHLKVTYTMRIPIPVFGIFDIQKEESMRIKGWCGYESSTPVAAEQNLVYMTETGVVYHRDYHCPYLDLSIHLVLASEIEKLRNSSGEIYHLCEKCGEKGEGMGVYVTDYGNRYHTSLLCSGLKRTVYAVPLSEAVGKGACSKCGH